VDQNEYSDPDLEDSDAVSNTLGIPELDIRNLTNPQHVPHYAEQICVRDQAAELGILLPVGSLLMMQHETGITHRNRATVVNWLIRVHSEWHMTSVTLFNSISCFDIVLSRIPIPKTELQLLGAVCIWMCAKLNEIHYPSVKDFRNQCRVPYKRPKFLEYEKLVFRTLHFAIEYPTVHTFLGRFLAASSANEHIGLLASFACEASLVCFELNQFRRSVIAISSILIAAGMLGQLESVSIPALLTYAHFPDLTKVVECTEMLMTLLHDIVEAKQSPSYAKFITGSEFEDQIRCIPDVFEQIKARTAFVQLH
jgi:hypothetical protein